MVIATLFILLFGLMLIGVPVAVALGASTLASAFLFTDLDLMGTASHIFDGLNKYTRQARPSSRGRAPGSACRQHAAGPRPEHPCGSVRPAAPASASRRRTSRQAWCRGYQPPSGQRSRSDDRAAGGRRIWRRG